MDLVIHDVPANLWESLDKKAKASGRSISAEARAVLENSLNQAASEELDVAKVGRPVLWKQAAP